MTRAASVAWLVLAVGCAPRTLVDLEVSGGEGPAALTVSAFDSRGLLSRTRLEAPRLPGTLQLEVAPDVRQVRVSAIDEAHRWGGQGAVSPRPGERTRLGVKLILGPADADEDTVADEVDNCRFAANPDQEDRDADGRGDVCAAGTDGGPEPSRCPLAEALLCEGFEGSWGGLILQQESAELSLDGGRAYRGAGAARVHVGQLSSSIAVWGRVRDESILPRAEWHARFFVFLPSGSVPLGSRIFEARYSATYEALELRLGSGGRPTLRLSDGTLELLGSEVFPMDRWVCVEVGVKRQSGVVDARVTLDGVELAELHAATGFSAPDYDQVLLGLGWLGPAGHAPVDAWFDEFVVMTSSVGCDR